MDMHNTELSWKERTSELAPIASVWTCNVAEIMSRTTLADPCISLILVRDVKSAEVIIRGPETKPRSELLMPGYTWTAIRLQPGVRLRHFAVQQFLDNAITLPADYKGTFQFEEVRLQFPDFDHAERFSFLVAT